jgi:hypothetical protein
MDDSTDHREPRRDLLAFDRTDRRGLLALLGLLALGGLLVWVVAPLRDWLAGAGIPLALVSPVSVPELDAAGVDHGLAVYDVQLADPTAGQRLLALAPGLLAAALLVVGCWFVLRVMRDIAAGDPFEPRNVTRLRVVAAILVIGVPVVFFLDMAVRGALLGSMDLGGLEPALFLSIPWQAVVAGMVVALLAEAFRAGSRLRDDVAGLV